MRVAVYHGLPAGGAKRATYEHVRRLAERHTVDVFALGVHDEEWCDLLPLAHRYTAVDFQPSQLFRSPLGQLNDTLRLADALRLRPLAQRLAAQIDAGGYHVVNVRRCQYTWTPWILQYLRTPVVYYCEDPNRFLYEKPPARPYNQPALRRRLLARINPARQAYFWLLRNIERRGLDASGRVLVNSNFMAAWIRELYGVEATTAYHGVDLDAFTAQNLPRRRVAVSVGALNAYKGFDFAIEILGRLPADRRLPLVIVSNHEVPAERAYLSDLAARLGVDVTMKSLVTHDELVRLYNEALITIYTPYQEPFGLVPLESMACGTPVLGIDEGGVRETVEEGVTGRRIPRDAERAAAILDGMLADADGLAALAHGARAYVATNWTWDASTATLERHLTAVADGK